MESIIRTAYASHLQTSLLLQRQFTVLPNSTINEKFNVFPGEVPSTNEYPCLKYIAIGNKGVDYEIGANNFILTKPIPHLPSHSGLYGYLPFIARTANNDLTATDRANYRMRVLASISGVDYVFYYLKVLPMQSVTPVVELRNVNDGVITTSTFIPVTGNLTPTPVVVNTNILNNPNGDYLVSTAKVDFILDQTAISEIIDACLILYNDARYAVISEIALCTGIDRTLAGAFGASTAPYTESVATQIAAFIHQYHALTSTTTGVQISIDIGASESLLM